MDLEAAVTGVLSKHKEHGVTVREIAKQIGKPEAHVLKKLYQLRDAQCAAMNSDGRWKPTTPK